HKYENELPGGGTLDTTGVVGVNSNPRWSGNVNAAYSAGPWTGFVQERFIGGGIYDSTKQEGKTIDDNHISAVFYTDATVAYSFGGKQNFQLYVTVNNLFDKDPPIAPQGALIFFPTNANLYDMMGRYFTAGVKFEL
ncbi:MAG: TonB-dependent receptor, partial [Solimonas sp.]